MQDNVFGYGNISSTLYTKVIHLNIKGNFLYGKWIEYESPRLTKYD